MILCALPPPALFIVNATGAEYKLGSTAEESVTVAVFVPSAFIKPNVSPTALDVWEWLGISLVVKVCVSAPTVVPRFLLVNPEPWPKEPRTRPLQSGKLNEFESTLPKEVPMIAKRSAYVVLYKLRPSHFNHP